MKTVLVVDHLRTSIPVVRALSQAGHTVIAGVSGYCDYVHWSRHVDEAVPMASVGHDDAGALRDLLRIFEARPEIDSLFPVCERGVQFLARNWNAIPSRIERYCASPEIIQRCGDKDETARLCDELNIPVARRRTVQSYDELLDAAREIGFPLVVKPVESPENLNGHKVVVAREHGELVQALPGWPPETHERLMVQQFVNGPRHNVFWLAREGCIYAGVVAKVTRTTDGADSGFATAAISIAPEERFTRAAEALVAALGFHGAGCAQFVADPDTGAYTFLEINPRLDATLRCAEAAGAAYVRWFVDLIDGAPLPERPDPWAYEAGRRYVWTKGEYQAARALADAGQARDIPGRMALAALDALRATHATFYWDDPAPALGCHLNPIFSRLGLGEKRLLPRQSHPA